MSELNIDSGLAALRREFDRGFAHAPTTRITGLQNFLGLLLGDDAFAIRITDMAGLYKDRLIAPMPSGAPAFLGVAGFRSLIVPVYDLAALLGYAPALSPGWLMLFRLNQSVNQSVALAFEKLDTHFSAKESELIPAPQRVAAPGSTRMHLSGAVRAPDAIRPIIHISSLIQSLQPPDASHR